MKQAKHITHKQLGIEQKRRLDWGIKKISNQQLNVNQKKKKISQLIFSHKKKAKRKYHRPKDIHIDVEDNPNFDDDSIKENIGGIKEEFSL